MMIHSFIDFPSRCCGTTSRQMPVSPRYWSGQPAYSSATANQSASPLT